MQAVYSSSWANEKNLIGRDGVFWQKKTTLLIHSVSDLIGDIDRLSSQYNEIQIKTEIIPYLLTMGLAVIYSHIFDLLSLFSPNSNLFSNVSSPR